MGALSVFGGIGQGISDGTRANLVNEGIDQENKLRAGRLRQMADEIEMKDQVKGAMGKVQTDADARQAGSTGAGLRAGKAAAIDAQSRDASAADNFSAGLGADTAVSPSTSSINALSPTAAPDLKTIGKNPKAAGIGAAGLGMPAPKESAGMNLASSPGPRDLPAKVASAADAVVTGMSARDAYNATWKEQAPHVAAIYQKYGRPDIAEHILKSGDAAEMETYERKWKAAMRAVDGGSDQQAAAAIQSLYNTDFPDGHGVDIRVTGPGQYQVVQYDEKTGKETRGQAITKDQLVEYGQTLLNPAERVKLWVADKAAERSDKRSIAAERSRQYHDDSVAATSAFVQDQQNTRQDKMLHTLISVQQLKNDGKPPKADVDTKATDAEVKASSGMIKSNKSIKPEDQAAIQALVSDNITVNGMKAGPAIDAAIDHLKTKKQGASTAANEHMAGLHTASPWNETFETTMKSKGDPEIVKSLGSGLNETSYKKAYAAKQMSGAVAAAPVQANSTKVINGVTYTQNAAGQWMTK